MKCIVVLLLIVSFAGCQSADPFAVPNYDVPVGSTLTLNRDLLIPADSVRVYIQNGEVIPYGANRFYPYCTLEVRRKLAIPQRLPAGTLVVDNFARHRTQFVVAVDADARPGLRKVRLPLLFSRDDPGLIEYASYFYFQPTEAGPEVLNLTCSHLQDWGEGRFLTVPEIQATLGNVMSLRTVSVE